MSGGKGVVDALPDLPVEYDSLGNLHNADGVIGIVPELMIGPLEGGRSFVAAFGISLESGVLAALGWDPETREWILIDRVTDFEDREVAAEGVERSLEEWIGDPDEYEMACFEAMFESE